MCRDCIYISAPEIWTELRAKVPISIFMAEKLRCLLSLL